MEEATGVSLEFRILGPLEVTRHGEPLLFRGTREQALLALLVLNANRTVAAERLTEDLWSGEPPQRAIRSLRVYVSRVRQTLGADGQIITRPSGYVLRVAPEAIDAVRFEALVARGRDQARDGDHERAAKTLREALRLWRGPALADVADAPFARAEAARLEEARLAAVEDRVDADLASGRHGEVTAELEALTGDHSFRERLWSQRIIALYRCERQAEALRAYQQLRVMLAEELGLEPSSALQQLEGAVLRHDPALDWHPTGERVATSDQPGRPGAGTAETRVATGAANGPLPQPLTRRERLPVVGREIELTRLGQLWQATGSGERHLVLVAGEPGIGKSRLAAEFARSAHDRGAPVLFGRCDEGMGVPYQPFVEALGRYLRQVPQPALGRLAGELVRLVPDVAERVDGLPPPLRSDPETERYRLFDAVAAWLGGVSDAAPVLFVIEDLHWATKPTLLLLSHLLRSDEELRFLLLVTFRDTPLDMTPDLADLVAELLRLPGVERLRLAGLDEPGIGALMEAQAGHDLDDEGWALARIVHGETAGNPFYVREMLSLLAEKGDIVRRDGRWVPGLPLAQLDVPDSVRDVVERRLTRLPDQTSEMLALAAVLGERFDLAVLAEASDASETSVVDTLRPAVTARLVNETDAGRYQFTHALVRSALEDALGPTRRLQLHRAAGSAVEAVHAGHLDDHLPQLAHHFARAHDVDKAIDYASRAGDRALAQLAHDEAAGYYGQALELLDAADADPDRRPEILISLGEAQRRGGDPAYRDTLLTAAGLARQRGDSAALARAALANTRGGIVSPSVDAERIATLDAAIEVVPPDDKATRARLLANLAVEVVFLPERDPAALSNEALALCRDVADDATLAHVLRTRYYTITRPETSHERWANTRELLDAAERLGDPAMLLQAHYFRARSSMETGDIEEFDRSLAVAERLASDLGQPTLQWVNTWQRVGRVIFAGPFDEAERLSAEALKLGESSVQRDAYLYFMMQRFAILFDRGRLAELFEPFDDLRASNPPLRFLEPMLAVLHVELGHDDDARHILGRWAASDFDALPRDVTRIRAMTSLAVAAAHLQETASARALYDLLTPHGHQIDMMVTIAGAVAHYLGLLAATIERLDEADAHFAAAADVHERVGALPWLARTRLEWARMLLSRRRPGDAERALDLLGQALETARELGLATIEREAANLLASQ